jgi:hypothetical protein
VKVTFDTETDSYERALAMLHAAYGRDRPNPGPATSGPASEDDQEPLTGIVIGNLKNGNPKTGNPKTGNPETGNPNTGNRETGDHEPGAHTGENLPAGTWTRGRLERFVRGLDQVTAEAIRYIAAHAPAAPVTATLEHVSRYMFTLRLMSNFEQFDARAMFASPFQGLFDNRPGIVIPDGPDSPVTRDDRDRTYRMDPAAAALVTELLGAPVPDENRR